MVQFNLVVFGITSNLSQLKIIPALYDLEEQNLLHSGTKVIGIGRKDINIVDFVKEVLSTPNRHHQHSVDPAVVKRLSDRFEYLREDIKEKNEDLYQRLTEETGNILYYLATYPDLYKGIFDNLKKYGLNAGRNGWTKIMIEKPIGHDYASSHTLNELMEEYFTSENIFRMDHYLGKMDLMDIFNKTFNPEDVDHVQLSVLEDFGIGKRGVYYDATGALIDMGQNHLMQMVCAIAKKEKTVDAREEVIKNLVPDPDTLVFGQYEGYGQEENIPEDSTTDTYFALKTEIKSGPWKGIPVYMRSGKKLNKSEVKISLINKNGKVESFVIISTGADKKYDPYEKLITEAVNGDQFYFNSSGEVEYAWKFIDALTESAVKKASYKPGTSGPVEADKLIEADGRRWV
jgi:glucose-6-phosphate 1-dehydrogenase